MRFVYLAVGVLAALLTGTVVLFTLGTVVAVLTFLLVVGLTIYAAQSPDESRPAPRIMLAVLLLVSGGLVIYGATTVLSAFAGTSGPADAADAAALASADKKLDEDVGENAGFRVELTSEELTALVQNQLAKGNGPFRRMTLKVVADDDESGHILVDAAFRNGDMQFRGRMGVDVEAGRLKTRLNAIEVGALNLPGVAQGAVEDLINPFANEALEEGKAEIQAVRFGPDRLTVVGVQSDGEIVTGGDLIAAFPRQLPGALTAPSERIGAGVVNGLQAEGDPVYLALGDSLAANVGVAEARDGYVSRFHKHLQEKDGAQYGLRNLGSPVKRPPR